MVLSSELKYDAIERGLSTLLDSRGEDIRERWSAGKAQTSSKTATGDV
ncbi:MAG TPA: hypothetical protein VL197_14010 [Nitrospirota bacterium]|nr:hypothetical protein [Nitrospirota bacterium]